MVWLKWTSFSWVICAALYCEAFAADITDNNKRIYSYYNKNASVSYYQDFNSKESIESIWKNKKWTENTTGKVLNFGFVDYPVWIRFEVDASMLNSARWYLVIPYPLLQKAEAYLVEEQTNQVVWKSDLDSAFNNAEALQSHQINFLLPSLSAKFATLYLRVESNTSLQVPLEIWERKALLSQQNTETLLWGLYFGVLLALSLYNGFLFLSMRDMTYLYYVFTLVSVCFLMLCVSGFGLRYIWNSQLFTIFALPLSTASASFWLLCFSLSFLKPKNINIFVRLLMQILAVLVLLAAAFLLYMPEAGAQATGFIGATTLILVTLAGVTALMRGQVIARFFVFATASFAIGAILYIANVFGLAPSSRVTNHAFQAGSVLEALLFSFALAHRIKEERRQKLVAMKKVEQAQRTIVEVQHHALQQALHDPVTRRPNESLLNNRISDLINDTAGINSFALVLVSFPRLKQISSAMGRRLAIEFFQSVIERLQLALTNDIQSLVVDADRRDYVAVEEFGSLMFLCKTGEEFRSVYDFALSLTSMYEKAIQVGEFSTNLDVCGGVAFYPKHGDRAELLIQHATAARDFGLRTGEVINIYSSEVDTFGRRRLALVGALSQAVKQQELEIYLQPQFECGTHALVGAEALLRWNSEELGVVSPTEFIEVAEEAGLMSGITQYVIDQSFKALKSFNCRSIAITMSINLSIQNLVETRLVPYVISAAEKHMINLSDVVFEVTETSTSKNLDTVIETLNQLAATGSRISLDDYGTGYSSLEYLSRLPIHELKIDRSFVKQMTAQGSGYRIVENTVKLAKALQLETVAEGVEDISTLNAVSRLGCNRVQGFYFAKPMPVAQFEEWLVGRLRVS